MKKNTNAFQKRMVTIAILSIATIGIFLISSSFVRLQGNVIGDADVIVDDSQSPPTVTLNGSWMMQKKSIGYKGNQRISPTATSTATWRIPVTPQKIYVLMATWSPYPYGAKVLYTVRNENGLVLGESAEIDQKKEPSTEKSHDGTRWETIAKITPTSGYIFVTLHVSNVQKNSMPGILIADAVRARKIVQIVCGDGVSEESEQCDDGNAVANDGCTECQLDFCSDTDASDAFPGGIDNSSVPGTVKGTGGGGGIFTDSDRCLDTTTLLEYGCIGTQTNATNITCDNGCSNGACIQSSASSHSNSSSSYSSECWDPQHCSSGSSSSGRRSF
jgi:cysteine-rich repeat protein